MDTPAFEQIDAAFRGFDIAKQQVALEHLAAQGPARSTSSVIGEICPIYKAVRPFLQAAAAFPFIPPLWRSGISAFITAMDLLCP